MWCAKVICLVVAVVCVGAHRHHNHGNHHKQQCSTAAQPGNPEVVTPSGCIRGSWMETRRGRRVQGYRGIRYASPPVGELRFQPPEPILQYSSDVDASKEGPACPQPVFDPDYYVHEDCLRLNVYTPDIKHSKLLPVLMYIHSGGFYSVSGRSDVAGPEYLLDQDLVLVTINYRLGSLGFLSTGDKHAPGNNGYKDQVVALKWVQRNIAAFGGDPNLVTISGCSAGSFSVMLHMLSPMSKGLFHRAVSISGSPISHVPVRSHQKELAVKQAELLGCPTTSSKSIITCLRTKPWRDIGNSLDHFFSMNYDPVLLWAPIVEPDLGQERFLVEQPLAALLGGRMHAVPYILGQTTREFFWKAFYLLANQTNIDTMNSQWETMAPVSFLLPPEGSKEAADRLKQAYLGGRALQNDSATADGLGKLYGDSLIGFGVHRLANLMSLHSPKNVYYYEFAHIGNQSHYEDPITRKPVASKYWKMPIIKGHTESDLSSSQIVNSNTRRFGQKFRNYHAGFIRIGAAHHDDLIYLFGLPVSFPLIPPSDSEDSRTVDLMTRFMYNFAKTGEPNPLGAGAGPAWPPMGSRRRYLRIAHPLELRENMFEDRFRVWDELYPVKEQED